MLLPPVQFNDTDQCFQFSGAAPTAELLVQMPPIPLESLTFQLARTCNVHYCSEPPAYPQPAAGRNQRDGGRVRPGCAVPQIAACDRRFT